MASTELIDTNEHERPLEHGKRLEQEQHLGQEQDLVGTEALAGEPEAWEPWETRLVLGSLAIGAAGLVVLGWLVDRFILS